MIRVEWTTSPSRGYVDALPDWVLDVDAPAVLVHAIWGRGAAGRPSQNARFEGSVTGSSSTRGLSRASTMPDAS